MLGRSPGEGERLPLTSLAGRLLGKTRAGEEFSAPLFGVSTGRTRFPDGWPSVCSCLHELREATVRPALEKTSILNVEIPDRTLAQTLLEKWSEQAGVTLSILRGRVTPEEARYQLEIRGPAANVARVVRQSASWDASRRVLTPAPRGALA